MKHITQILTGLTLLATSFLTHAATISGAVEVFGFTPNSDTAPLSTATGLVWTGGNAYAVGDTTDTTNQLAGWVSGAESGNSTLTLTDFDFALTNGSTTIWKSTLRGETVSFALNNITITEQTNTKLTIDGQGILSTSITGYDPTDATFTFTYNKANGSVFASFSSTTTASPVPLPAAAWLFGSALAGIVAVGRRKKTHQA